jgi:hypothetical protein
MAHQFVREPLRAEEAVRLANAGDCLTTTAIYLNLTDGHVLDEFEAKW